jgi:hypothetical protein
MDELDAMVPSSSQYSPADEIPERSWVYRLAKRIALHEYGVYSQHFQPETWIDPRPATPDASDEAATDPEQEDSVRSADAAVLPKKSS